VKEREKERKRKREGDTQKQRGREGKMERARARAEWRVTQKTGINDRQTRRYRLYVALSALCRCIHVLQCCYKCVATCRYTHTSLYICASLHTYIAIYMCRYAWLHTYHRCICVAIAIYVSPCTYIATSMYLHISFVWIPSSDSSVAFADKILTKTSCVI